MLLSPVLFNEFLQFFELQHADYDCIFYPFPHPHSIQYWSMNCKHRYCMLLGGGGKHLTVVEDPSALRLALLEMEAAQPT